MPLLCNLKWSFCQLCPVARPAVRHVLALGRAHDIAELLVEVEDAVDDGGDEGDGLWGVRAVRRGRCGSGRRTTVSEK